MDSPAANKSRTHKIEVTVTSSSEMINERRLKNQSLEL